MLASVALLPSVWLAAVLLLARAIAERHELPCPTAKAILEATGASKSRAYEIVAKLTAVLPTLVRAPGRPTCPSLPSAVADEHTELMRAVLAYVMAHPGCVDQGAERNRYSDGFRRFVLDLHKAARVSRSRCLCQRRRGAPRHAQGLVAQSAAGGRGRGGA